MTTSASNESAQRARENERPLVEDIRLLGRILGDVIRDQDGTDAFELIEQIRKLSVAFRRHADQEADHAPERCAYSGFRESDACFLSRSRGGRQKMSGFTQGRRTSREAGP